MDSFLMFLAFSTLHFPGLSPQMGLGLAGPALCRRHECGGSHPRPCAKFYKHGTFLLIFLAASPLRFPQHFSTIGPGPSRTSSGDIFCRHARGGSHPRPHANVITHIIILSAQKCTNTALFSSFSWHPHLCIFLDFLHRWAWDSQGRASHSLETCAWWQPSLALCRP